MVINVKRFADFTLDELYAVLFLRNEVFVVEQDCVYQDLDGADADAIHLFVMDGKYCIACLRIFRRNAETVQIGRVVVAQSQRKTGLGRALMEKALCVIGESFNAKTIYLEAQTYAVGFYAKFGFVVSSEPFLEDGIPHVQMTRTTL